MSTCPPAMADCALPSSPTPHIPTFPSPPPPPPLTPTALSYLLAQRELNLTAFDNATLNDNYVLTLELAPTPKAPAAAFLADVEELWPALEEASRNASALKAWLGQARSLRPPPRQAQVLLLMGAMEPPRVVQVGC